jgi:alpha-tubulin suppressor-like RCC1 family protein
MQKKKTLVSSEKFSIRAHCWCLVNTLFIGLLWIFIGLQALGMRQLIASEVALKVHARSVVLIDSAVAFSIPKEELVGSQVIPIDGNGDVIAQITKALGALTDIDVLRVISHGSDGKLWFGTQAFDTTSLHAYSQQVTAWSESLSADAQILLYGCRVAETDQGRSFVNQLATSMHARVAASTDVTGMGGDTNLEFEVGRLSDRIIASAASYERADVSLQGDFGDEIDAIASIHWNDIETWNSQITSWTNNQNGTATVTMAFDLRGEFYVGHDNWSNNGYVYMYRNNIQVASKYINVTRNSSSFTRVTFTATFPLSIGNNRISVSPREGTPTIWSDRTTHNLPIQAPYFYGAPAAARAHTVAVGSGFSYYYYVAGTDPKIFTATGLPDGLTMSTGGVVSGYPRSGSAGVYQVNIRASNGFGTCTLPVSFTITNQAPDFASTSAATISGGVENTPLTISYATLAAAVGATDPNNTSTAIYNGWAIDPISFRIESLLGGTLTKNGTPITAGTTSIAAGENLVWTPPDSVNGVRDAFTIKAYDGALYSAATKTVKVSVGAVNDAPTLTSFSGPVTAGTEDSSILITFADLMAKGDEADIDSAVTSFVVKEVTTGSLKIGTSEGSATPWNASTNKVITASLIGYWTPDPNANGPQSALKVVARDDAPLESATPVQAVVSVSPSTDAPTLTAVDIISGQTEGEPMEISYTSIAAAADEADVDGDVISFRIEAVSSGTLQKWSSSAWAAVVPGTTLIAAGEKLRWTPTIGTTGLQNAFTIKAWDGQFASATVVQLKIDASRWTIVPWTAAATSGLDPRYRYTHAYSFGSSDSFSLGGISFTGIAGGNPSVEGKLSTTNFGSFTINDDNNLSDASRSLANDFVYGSSAVQTVTLRGLIPGTRYVLSLFSVGADSTRRDFTLQGVMGQVAVNQNEFGNNNGIRIDYKYLADSSGAATITITPASGSFNLYGIANRESSPSATLYPPSSLTYDGSPKNFQSASAPRNEPFVSAGRIHSVVLKSDGTVSAFGTNNQGQTNVPAGLNNVVAVSAGDYHTLALKSDGTVVAWGENSRGQSSIPAGLSGVVAISARRNHNLALKSDGTVVAWGLNDNNQTTVPVGLTGIVAISAGVYHSMALKSDGTVVVWGVRDYPPADLTNVVAISAGEWHSLALKSDGTVVAWGNNGSLQSKVPAGLKGVVAISAGTSHSVAVKSDGTVVAWGDRDNSGLANIPAGLSEVIAISAGRYHTITLKADGTVVSFGSFGYGQQFLPTALGALTGISTGNDHTLAVKPDGTVLAWGQNTYGQTSVPNGLSGVVAVQAGDALSVALKSDKTVVAWGGYSSSMPAGLTGVDKIAASAKHVLALKTDGTVVAWGDNTHGQCNVPAGLANVRNIAAGEFGSLALKADGTVVFWGNEMSGLSYLPQGLSGVTVISAGTNFGLALKSDGSVVAWGKPTETYWNLPAGLSGVIAIEAGDGHALAIKSDGSVVAWGGNDRGETTVPATVNGTGVIALAAGWRNSIALKSDGTIVAWGDNSRGKNSPPASAQFPSVGLPGRSYTFNVTYAYSYEGRGATTYAASTTAPTNAGDYTVTAIGNGATITQNFTINKVTPIVYYLSRENSITYGTALNSNHVDSSSPYWWNQGRYTIIPSSKVYSPAIGSILPVGTHPLSVTLLPTDSVNFNPAVATGTITVTKAAVSSQNITLPSLEDLTFNGLSKNHAATAAGVSGFTYIYTGRAGTSYGPSTVAPTYAGSYTVTVSINDANYTGTKSLDFAIGKATPTITSNPTVSAISYGQSLAASSLSNGTASVPGVFAFNTPSTTPSAGASNHPITFTPTDTANYNPVSSTVSITTNTVALNSSNIAFTAPASLVYSGTQKTFTASASGISTGFTYSYSGIGSTNYSPTSTPPTNAGNYAVTATVTNANYTGSATQTFTITKATPAITWATPASISYGTALSATQLNAATSVAGSFVYSPASGVTLATGARTLQAIFTPTDTANYNSATASVPILVSSSSRPISLIAPPSLTYDGTAKTHAVSQMPHIAAGFAHSLAIKADGTVVAWGSNSDDQSNVPVNLSGVIQVTAGFYHSLALKADGSVVGWGKNDKHQRANIQGSFAPYTGYSLSPNPPYLVLDPPAPTITNGIAVAGGGRLSLVLKADGTVAAIGMKDNGSNMPTTQEHALKIPAGLTGVIAIAAGWDHALALKSDGTVVAWDGNQYGESTVPAGLSGVVAIAAGQDHSIALKSDGTVVAWGRNNFGQCTVPSSVTNVVAIASGDNESYALKKDGSLVYWGSFGSNEVVSSGSGVIAISAGASHLLMLKSDGSLLGWGDNNSSQISLPAAVATSVGNFAYSFSYAGRAGTTYAASSTAPTNAGHYTLTVTSTDQNFSGSKTVDFTIAKSTPALTSLPVAAIITEGQALSAVTLNGGSASVNGTFAFSTPSFIPPAGASTQSITFTPTDSNNYHSVTASITVLVEGENAATPTISSLPSASAITLGQLLNSSTLSGGIASVPGTFEFSFPFASPNPGPASQSVTFIPADIAHYKAVTFSVPMTVYDGIVSPLNLAVVPPASLAYDGLAKPFRVSRSSLLSAGRWGHVLVVKSDGTVFATGDNSAGQCNVPAGLTGVVAVASGISSSMALKSDGTVIEWGASWMGMAPSDLSGVVAIARGSNHALALKSNGTVVAWGDNAAGQCNVPAGLLNVVGITGSDSTSYALKSDGTVVAWGAQPTIPDGLNGVIAIHASSDGGMVALKSNGMVVALGLEAPPAGLNEVVAVAAGRNHRVALKSDGTVVAWGSGTPFTPTGSNVNLVPWNLTNVVAIAAGDNRSYAMKADGSVVWWGNGSGTAAYRVNGEVYRTPEGVAVSVPELQSILTTSSAGFAFSSTYTGRDSTTYAASVTPPTEPGDYTVTVTSTDPDFAATKTIDFTITKGRPTILSIPYRSGITYGESLASYPLLGGTASVPGTFAFENPGTIPNAGESLHNLVFTPTDTEHYQPVTVSIKVKVDKANPLLVALPAVTRAIHGQTLAEATLANGITSVSGTFTFTSTAPVSAGTMRQTVTFTPDDTTNYNALTAELDVTVAPATPSVLTSPTATPIAAGQTLSSSTLIGGEASVEGTFTWENSNTAPDTGTTTQNFVFTPNDTANYTSTTGTVSVTVNKATPTVTTPPIASAITYGQSLSHSTLDGGIASVAGTFAWTNPATEPDAGTATHAFTFTPDDTTNYQAAAGTVSVTVHKALASITLGNLNASYDGTAKSASVSTTPEGLTTILTYNGESTAPSDVGAYEVVATIDDANFTGTKSELLTIAQTRLFGIGGDPLGQTTSSVMTLAGMPSIQGIACDGTRIFVNSSASEIRVYDLNGTWIESHAVENLPPLGNNQMAFAGGYLYARNDDSLYRISTTDWSSTLVAVDSSHPMLTCAWWMYGSLFDTPDGKLGVMGPTVDGQFTVRLYQLSSDGLTLTWERDQVINDTWSTDEHGMACDGVYFYRMSMLDGCKVYDLATGEIVHGGEGWNLWSAADGGTIDNPTWLTRNHRTGQLIAGEYQADHLLVFTPDDGINFTAPQSMIYDGSGKVFSASSTVPCTFAYTYKGIGITSYGPTTEAPKNAGNYVVTASSTDSSLEGSSILPFIIVPKNLTVTSDAKTKLYGAVDPALTYQSSGLEGEDEITGSLNRAPGENAGSYSILQGSITAGANYAISYISSDLIIEKVPISPTNFLAAQTTNFTIDLSWTPDGTQNSVCTGFLISHKPSASETWTENAVGAEASTFSVSSLLPGTVYHFRIVALNGTDRSSQVTTTLTTWTSLEEWRFTNFGTIANSGNAADNANPSNDGMPNLMKYALGMSANARSNQASLNTQMNANGRLTLTFRRAREDLIYIVEGSDDLITWSIIATNPGAAGETVTVTDTAPIHTSKRFIRLKVSR